MTPPLFPVRRFAGLCSPFRAAQPELKCATRNLYKYRVFCYSEVGEADRKRVERGDGNPGFKIVVDYGISYMLSSVRTLRVLFSGASFNICGEVNAGGRCRAEEALRDHTRSPRKGAKRMSALLEAICDQGLRGFGSEECESLRDGLYELKEARGLLRVVAFRPLGRQELLILVRVFRKNPGEGSSSKQQNQQIHEARQYCRKLSSANFQFEEKKES